MWEKIVSIRTKRKTTIYFVVAIIALASVTPALADYLGPNRTVTETTGVCRVILYECQYVTAKQDWRYRISDSWSCSNEGKPWQAYPDQPSSQGCFAATNGDQYWAKDDTLQEVTTTYPPATISSALQNCSENNGWCLTSPQLSLSAIEPVAGYSIAAIEGSLNGQTFACLNAICDVPLNEGDNTVNYWALSTWGDSSTMGSLTVKVDSQLPAINGSLSGISGSNGWYLSPVSFNGSASDPTSGLASFSCTLDGTALSSCSPVTINAEGAHTLVLTALDNAGNIRTLTQGVSLDTQNPNLSAGINGTLGSNNWFNTATLNAAASDPIPGSGLSKFEYNLDKTNWITFPVSGIQALPDGKHAVDIRAMDNAGHTVLSSKTFWLDTVQPSVTVNSTGTLGANNWYINNPSITASVNDDTSGMDLFEYSLDNQTWTAYTTPLTLTNGTHSISFWAQDQSGLVKQVDRTYQVDTRPPQIAGNISGVPGANGWYISNVTLSASASDPTPGSGLDAFTYILNNSAETPYTTSLSLADGQHTVQLKAQDQAGLKYSVEQSIKVDTIQPSLSVSTLLPTWTKEHIALSGAASDSGSGLSKVEISTDGDQTWQTVTGTTSWEYDWDTLNSSDGSYNVHMRVTDKAGLATEQTMNVGVDNHAPRISLLDSWYQWNFVTLDIWDNFSGIAEARVEISDPEGRWPKRVIRLDPREFPLSFKWDRRFGDNTIAPLGTYNVRVTVFDNVGNMAQQSASIKILLDILPAGPAATPQPYSRPEATPTAINTAAPIPSPSVTPTAVISVFGDIEPTTEDNATPAAQSTPRATPTQTGVWYWLESIFVSNENSTEQTTEIQSSVVHAVAPQTADAQSNILWGAAAAAVIGATTSYIFEENRKRKEEQEWQEFLEAEKEESHEKRHALKMAKLETKWAQEKILAEQQLQREQFIEDERADRMDSKMARLEAEDDAKWMASQAVLQQRAKAEELQAGLAAYYEGRKKGESTTPDEPSWWQKTWAGIKDTANKVVDWADQHQTEIALGIGAVVGVTAIVLSGGLATPWVAAGWVVGSAAIAGAAAAVGTISLNVHYQRAWNEKLLGNILAAGATAAVITGAAFLFHAVMGGLGTYCAANQNVCGRIEPIFNALDTAEEAWLSGKLAYQTWRNDPAALDTLLELQMEHMDGGMPGNAVSREIKDELVELSDDAIRLVEQYGDDIIPLLVKYQGDAVDIINAYDDEGIAILQQYGDEAIKLVQKHGTPAVKVLKAVDLDSANLLLDTLDDDVLDYATQQGPDAIAALSHWKKEDLAEHGLELALRSKKDAKVLADVKKLVALGPIDPKRLTTEQRELIDAIAVNSTQYDDEGQVVLGKWIDISNGFVERAKDTGSVHYNPHPDMWNLLGELGGENQGQAAWLINQQVVQTGINRGLPFEYTLNGVPSDTVKKELTAVQALFSGKTDDQIMRILKTDYMPIRMKELQELQEAGYEFTFDGLNNSYIFIKP